VSDNIDEYKIDELNQLEHKADTFGVGTRLITGYQKPALNGVYKINCLNGKPLIKLSDNAAKASLPGKKKLYRFTTNNTYSHDLIQTEGEAAPPEPEAAELRTIRWHSADELQKSDIHQIRSEVFEHKTKLAPALLRFDTDASYRVKISDKLRELQKDLSKIHGL